MIRVEFVHVGNVLVASGKASPFKASWDDGFIWGLKEGPIEGHQGYIRCGSLFPQGMCWHANSTERNLSWKFSDQISLHWLGHERQRLQIIDVGTKFNFLQGFEGLNKSAWMTPGCPLSIRPKNSFLQQRTWGLCSWMNPPQWQMRCAWVVSTMPLLYVIEGEQWQHNTVR